MVFVKSSLLLLLILVLRDLKSSYALHFGMKIIFNNKKSTIKNHSTNHVSCWGEVCAWLNAHKPRIMLVFFAHHFHLLQLLMYRLVSISLSLAPVWESVACRLLLRVELKLKCVWLRTRACLDVAPNCSRLLNTRKPFFSCLCFGLSYLIYTERTLPELPETDHTSMIHH